MEKKAIKHINYILSDFSSSDESHEGQMFFDKYLSWLLFSLCIINT